jgi:hypothetical protein
MRTASCPVRPHGLLEAAQLAHHLVVDLQSPRGVDDHDAVAGALRLVDARSRDPDHVLGVALGVDGDAELRPQRLELINGRGPVDVCGHEARRPPLRFELACQLRGGSRLP